MSYHTVSTYLSERDTIVIKSMVSIISSRLTEDWQFVDAPPSQVLIFDVDQPPSSADLKTSICIPFGVDPTSQDQLVLPKPVRSNTLIDLLNLVARRMKAQNLPATHGKNASQTEETVENKQFFMMSEYWVGFLKAAKVDKKPRCFRYSDLPPVYVDPISDAWYSIASLKALKPAYAATARDIEVEVLSHEMLLQQVSEADLEARRRHVDGLLWCTTLASSKGRPIGHSQQNALLRLKKWPNFASLPYQPHHLNLAAFLIKHAASFQKIARTTNVPLADVVDFCNACTVLDLIHEEPAPNASTGITSTLAKSTQAASQEMRSLFGKILRRIKGR